MAAPLRVLVFGEELRLRPAVRVAACAGAEVSLEEDPARIVEVAREERPAAILFDHDHAGPAALILARRLHDACPHAALVVLCHPSPPDDVATLLAEPWFHHLLALGSPWFMEELAATLAKLRGRDLFGLEAFLPWGTHIVECPIASSDDKQKVFGHIERFMDAIGVRARLVQKLCAIADEMLMNAVYDAPRDRDSSAHVFAELSRQTRVDLAPEQRPTLRFASDGRVFGLSITDPFGGLGPDTLRRYIAKGLRRGDDQIDRKRGGAGLGLFILFDGLNSMCLNLDPGRRTEVVGLVNIRGSYRDVTETPKSFNIFVRSGR